MHHELAKLLTGRWLIDPTYFGLQTHAGVTQSRWLQSVIARVDGMTPTEIQASRERYAASSAPTAAIVGDVAVIEACGPITYKSSWLTRCLGWPTIEDLRAQIYAAQADPTVKTIVIRWDSPGGIVDMVKEFADDLYALRGTMSAKPVISVGDLMICSAAYWLASQTQMVYATETSQIGSIGVYLMHVDYSGALAQAGVTVTYVAYGAHKVDGNPYAPLTDDVRGEMQAEVDEIGGWFDTAVARGRGVTKKVVADTFGQGQVFSGPKAIELGLADKRGTFQQLLGRLTRGKTSSAVARLAIARRSGDPDDTEDCVEPNDDGACPDGYDYDDEDGLCYLAARVDPGAQAQADADADAAAAAIRIAERP